MFPLLQCLGVAQQVADLVTVLFDEMAGQGQVAGRSLVGDAPAGRAGGPFGMFGVVQFLPGPAAGLVGNPAFRAERIAVRSR